jgi:hypothetical protein
MQPGLMLGPSKRRRQDRRGQDRTWAQARGLVLVCGRVCEEASERASAGVSCRVWMQRS